MPSSIISRRAPHRSSVLPDYRDLLRLSEDELARIDIAVVNLACAVGLPGWEAMDVARCLTTLDDMAIWVGEITEKCLGPEFHVNPDKYYNSEPLFRMVKLVHVLQEFFGILYNPARIKPNGKPAGAEDEFIFGAIQGPGGTCGSLPVVYTAVARRLGYPVCMVWTYSHAFCRWDDPVTGMKVNIEGTNHYGVNTYPDDHYRKWPKAFEREDEEFFGYLKSLSPREELASCMDRRSWVWFGAQEYISALDCLYAAAEIDPHPHPRYPSRIRSLVQSWYEQLRRQGKIGDRCWAPENPVGPRRWPKISWAWEAEILTLEAAEKGTNPPGWRRRWNGPPPVAPLNEAV